MSSVDGISVLMSDVPIKMRHSRTSGPNVVGANSPFQTFHCSPPRWHRHSTVLVDDVFELVDDIFVENPEQVITTENLDLTEPAHSFSRYFLFRKGDNKSKYRICNKPILRKMEIPQDGPSFEVTQNIFNLLMRSKIYF